jgi:hypothetical protein
MSTSFLIKKLAEEFSVNQVSIHTHGQAEWGVDVKWLGESRGQHFNENGNHIDGLPSDLHPTFC